MHQEKEKLSQEVYGNAVSDVYNTHNSWPRLKTSGGYDEAEVAPETFVQIGTQVSAQSKLESLIGFVNSPRDLAKYQMKLQAAKALKLIQADEPNKGEGKKDDK